MKTTMLIGGVALAVLAAAAPATAQTRPHHSGHMSFNAPQMHPHHSGLHHPNRPSHHHFHGHAGYKPVYHDDMHM